MKSTATALGELSTFSYFRLLYGISYTHITFLQRNCHDFLFKHENESQTPKYTQNYTLDKKRLSQAFSPVQLIDYAKYAVREEQGVILLCLPPPPGPQTGRGLNKNSNLTHLSKVGCQCVFSSFDGSLLWVSMSGRGAVSHAGPILAG